MVEISRETFNELVQNPNKITLDQSIALKNIIKKYPFFQVARVIELIGLKKFNNIRYKNALKKIIPDTIDKKSTFKACCNSFISLKKDWTIILLTPIKITYNFKAI